MVPSTSFFSRLLFGVQPEINSMNLSLLASFSMASYSASVSVVSEADPPNSKILRRWNLKSLRPCLSSSNLITLWSVCYERTILLMSSHWDRRLPPDLYKMWNFSRFLDALQHLNLTIQLQQESKIACFLVKINFLYLHKFCLISTFTTSYLVNVCCFFVIKLFSNCTASSSYILSGLTVSERLFFIFLIVF